jgi:hypothetical protein
MVDQFIVSIVENTRPRYRSSTCFSKFDQFNSELTATAPRETAIKKSAQPQFPI